MAFNDGSGRFPTATPLIEPFGIDVDQGRTIRLGDVDGDGDIDVVHRRNDGTNPSPNLTVEVRRNDGAGSFAPPVNLGSVGSSTNGNSFSLLVDDLDGDGTEDIVTSTGGTVRGLFATELTSAFAGLPFTPRTIGTVPSTAWVAGAEDLTGDGDVDVLIREVSAISMLPRRVRIGVRPPHGARVRCRHDVGFPRHGRPGPRRERRPDLGR